MGAGSIGSQAVAYQLDGDDEGSIAGMVQAAVDAFGTVDLLVNNVGATALAAQDGAVLDNSAELWDETFRINMRGYFLATKYALPHMLKQERGAIVHIASIAALDGDMGMTAYGASKAAIVNFIRAVAAQYGRKGVRSNSVCPGLIATDPPRPDFASLYKAGLETARTTRNGVPQDVGAMVAHLGADEAGFVNGGTFVCDGGQSSSMPFWRPADWQ